MALPANATFTWFGHSCWELRTSGGATVLFEPWFANPSSPKKPEAVDECDLMLVTHGHFDHFGDALLTGAGAQGLSAAEARTNARRCASLT